MPRVAKPKEPVVPPEIVAVADARVAADPRGAPITLPPTCVLDDAPINSVVVVLQWPGQPSYVHLQTPNGELPVPHDDYARSLPLMAEIRRAGTTTFVATQRDPALAKPPLVCTTAVECVRLFKRHFHEAKE